LSQPKSIDVSTLLLFIAVVWVAYIWMNPAIDTPPTPQPIANEVAATVAKAGADYRQGMARLYRDVSGRIAAGEVKTVTGFAEAVYVQNKELRQLERSQLQSLMESRLGNSDLDPVSAAAFVRELADAYEGTR
jgi:hypothetical protein